MKNFNIKNCPLCSKLLMLKFIDTIPIYMCPDKCTLSDGSRVDSHYKVICDYNINPCQQFVLEPFLLKTIAGTGKTKVFNIKTLVEIMEIPIVIPDEPERLRKRLRNLLVFV